MTEPAGAAVSAPAVSVFSDHCCHLGEGPTYDPQSDTLFWFDILERKLLAKKLSGGETRIHHLPEMASALAVIDAERQLVVTETGLHVRDVSTGAMRLHTSIEAGSVALRSNDARVHPCGAFWFSMMGRKAEAKAGAIYWFFKGELRKLLAEITIPNSICFSPDGATAYYTDSRDNLFLRVACDPLTGLPLGEPKVFYDHRGGEGGLDGSVVDAEGVLWNARWARPAASTPIPRTASAFARSPCRRDNRPARPLSARTRPHRRHLGLRRHGRGGETGRSRSRQDIPGRPPGQGPFRAACHALNGRQLAAREAVARAPPHVDFAQVLACAPAMLSLRHNTPERSRMSKQKPTLLLVYEPEAACVQRLRADGFADEHAAEISSYLAQSTDLAPEFDAIDKACAARGLAFVPVALDDAAEKLAHRDPETTLVWTLTDGVAYFRGSAGPALARLNGLKTIGADDSLFALCQDKFRSGAVLAALGLPVPASGLPATANG